jgi:hypothetical protein
MGLDFCGIRGRLQERLERRRVRVVFALLNLMRLIIVKLGPKDQKEKFAAEWATHDQKTGEKWEALHRKALHELVGLALSQWAGMEELLIGITGLLLRTSEFWKVGTIMYSIVSFPVWLGIIDDLFLLEPRYITLKPKWNKLSNRLRGLKETRDRLAHHTLYSGDKAATEAGDTSLRPGRFDIRQKVQKYQPLDYDQISKFIDHTGKVQDDLRALLNAMTAILTHETSQQKSSEPTPDQPPQ